MWYRADMCVYYINKLRGYIFLNICWLWKGPFVENDWRFTSMTNCRNRRSTRNQIRIQFPQTRRTCPFAAGRLGQLWCRRSHSTCYVHPRWRPASVEDCSGKHGCCFVLPSCNVSELLQVAGSTRQSGRRLCGIDFQYHSKWIVYGSRPLNRPEVPPWCSRKEFAIK